MLELYLPLMVGARVVMASGGGDGGRASAGEHLEEAGVTVMQATPATWKLMLARAGEAKKDLRVLCGGEALPPALAEELLERVGEVWNMYGPTETTVWSTIERRGARARRC